MAENGKPTTSDSTYQHTIQILQARNRELEEQNETLKRQIRNGVLSGREEIQLVYGWSAYELNKWIKMGMPILPVDRKLYAHKDNISDFFKAATRVNSSKANLDGE